MEQKLKQGKPIGNAHSAPPSPPPSPGPQGLDSRIARMVTYFGDKAIVDGCDHEDQEKLAGAGVNLGFPLLVLGIVLFYFFLIKI